ncbi:hypothetical protein BDN72DRAFT_754921 [Pluteus cervinus]|uniref:Uncharacterized protein n=1 Tax=Pluteus cervinus TaxID=181527 RepID=A0ACD3BGQ0_9AGAR|nr:hypothetical protein BDN72DRAFT_754921 [Pluteus cervinus]
MLNSRRYISASVTTVLTTVQQGRSAVAIPMIARVSLADYRGNAILDTYVRPSHLVSDYRTAETGIQYVHLANAPPFEEVQRAILKVTEDKILVGHSLWIFLSVLGLSHSALETRDLALYRPLRKKLKSKRMISLSLLVRLFMGRSVGLYYENSLENARAAMDLFRTVEESFEGVIREGAWPCDLPPRSYLDYYL